MQVDGKKISGDYYWSGEKGETIEIKRNVGRSWKQGCADCLEVQVLTDFGLKLTVTSELAAVILLLPKTDDLIGKVYLI